MPIPPNLASGPTGSYAALLDPDGHWLVWFSWHHANPEVVQLTVEACTDECSDIALGIGRWNFPANCRTICMNREFARECWDMLIRDRFTTHALWVEKQTETANTP